MGSFAIVSLVLKFIPIVRMVFKEIGKAKENDGKVDSDERDAIIDKALAKLKKEFISGLG